MVDGMPRCVLFLIFNLFFSFGMVLNLAQDKPEHRIGVLYDQENESSLQPWLLTAEYLNQQLPDHSFVLVPLEFDALHTSVSNEDVDFFIAHPFFYVEAEKQYGAQRLLTLIRAHPGSEGTRDVAGVLFCRSDQPGLQDLVELKGRSLMAEGEYSTAWLAVWREMVDQDMEPQMDLGNLQFATGPEAVVQAVEDGTVDVGCVSSGILERLALEGRITMDAFRVLSPHEDADAPAGFLHSTRHYPEWPFAKSAHIPDTLAHQVAIALMQMKPYDAAAQSAGITGWSFPSNYQTMHECMMVLCLACLDEETNLQTTFKASLDESMFYEDGLAAVRGLPYEGRMLTEEEAFSLRFWGQINRAALYANNGDDSEAFFVDNIHSTSRLGMAVDATNLPNPEHQFGGQVELGLLADSSLHTAFDRGEHEFTLDGRQIEAYWKSKRHGRLWFGKGDMASNGTAEQDLSGTFVIGYSQVHFMGSRLNFAPADASTVDRPLLRDVFNNFDGLHRRNRVRYDSPQWKGWMLSGSVASRDRYDAALSWFRQSNGHTWSTAFGLAELGNDSQQFSSSGSLRFSNGLNLSFSLSGRNTPGRSPRLYYGKVGYRWKPFTWGTTAVALDHAFNQDVSRRGDKARAFGVLFNQTITSWSTDIYAGVRWYDLSRYGSAYHDLVAAMTGVRFKF